MCGVSQAAITHKFEPTPTKAISEAALTCGTVTGALGEVNALTVDGGDLWLAEEAQGDEGVNERVDEFDASTGACVEQLKPDTSLVRAFKGVAVGDHVGEREIYVGARERGVEDTPSLVGVFGPSGVLQEAWTGSDTPSKSFLGADGQEVTDVVADQAGSVGGWANGDVFVSTAVGGSGVVDIFEPEADGKEKYLAQLLGTCPVGFPCTALEEEAHPFGNVQSVAVDPGNGDLLVADGAAVDVFKPAFAGMHEFEFVRQITGTSEGHPFEHDIHAVAAGGGESDGDIYVAEAHEETFVPTVVDQFNVGGVFLGSLTGTATGAFLDVESVAVDPVTHDVFVGDNREVDSEPGVVDVFGPDLVIPDVKTEEATEITASTAVLNGTVNPLSAETHEGASCEFEYGTTTSYGQHVACEQASVPGPEKVDSLVEHLSPDTTYHYRLAATNTNGTERGEDKTFQTKGPGIEGESASEVTSTSVKLGASVNPDGVATSYFFQYGRTSEYEAQVPAAPGSPLGSGSEPVAISPQLVQGLSPGREYHYRTVAVSEVEVTAGHVELHEFDGLDETFTTQTAGATGERGLPDHRQWQLVSPPDKHGALIEPIDSISGTNGDVIQAAADGDAITYVASAPTEPVPLGYTNAVQVFSTRGSSSWSTHDLTIPHAGATDASVGYGLEYRFFSEDLSSAIVQPFGAFIAATEQEEREPSALSDRALAPAEASEQTPFVHTDYMDNNPGDPCASACYRPMATGKQGFANVPSGNRFGEFGGHRVQEEGHACPPEIICGPQFVGATPDDSHVVLTSSVALTGTKIPATQILYEWDGAEPLSKQLQLVSELPGNEGGGVPVSGAFLGGPHAYDTRGAISSDGSRVFWTSLAGIGGPLYMRDLLKGETVRVDLPEPKCVSNGTCGKGPAEAFFQFASSNGSRVFFTDTQRLTENSGATMAQRDLYECVIVEAPGGLTCRLTDLTPRSAAGESAGVGGAPTVLGASEDGSYVYFVANGILENDRSPVRGAVHGKCVGAVTPEAVCNLYVQHEGRTSLVAVLSGEDDPDWSGGFEGALDTLTARVSPNGKWLTFMSNRSLTGYDNRDAVSGHADQEVYLYHAPSGNVETEPGTLICASCDPSGARPVGEEYGPEGHNVPVVGGNEVWETSSWLAADLPGWTPYRLTTADYQSRYLSNSGRLFFNSHDALVPQAVNHNWDVYEWEPSGVPAGSGHECSTATPGFTASSGGCVGLISSGESPDESAFLDASESGGEGPHGEELKEGGGDVFFMTSAKLAPQDTDDSYDVYDAHECTSASPCLPTPAEQPPACTTADSCRAAPTPQPEVFGAPSSATFSGPGNLGGGAPNPPAKPKPPTAAELRAKHLKAALKLCRKDRKRSKRLTCEKQARKKFGAKAASHPYVRKGHA